MIRQAFQHGMTSKKRNRFSGVSLVVAVGMLAGSALAARADEVYKAEYNISILGLTIASASTQTQVKGDSYELNGTFKTSGLARVFDSTKGTTRVTGTSANGKVVPSFFDLAYRHGKKDKRTTLNFKNGNIVGVENVPPIKKRDPWVELTPQHLLNVSDALSGLMIPAKSPAEVCNRTIAVFDGQTRADIKLTFNGTESISTKGFTGEAVICAAKFTPLAGFQKGKKSLEYLSNKSKITVSFAPMGNSGIYAPVIARIGTQLGTLKVSATRFEKA